MEMRKTLKEVEFIPTLRELIIITFAKVFVGLPLPTVPQLLRFGEQVVQEQKCAVVVLVFQEIQAHTLRKLFR
jgi:hypothetical protein